MQKFVLLLVAVLALLSNVNAMRKCGTPKRRAEIRPRGSEKWKKLWSGGSHAKLAASCAGQCYDTKWCGCYEFEREGKDMGYCKLYQKGSCSIKKGVNNKTFAGRCWGKLVLE